MSSVPIFGTPVCPQGLVGLVTTEHRLATRAVMQQAAHTTEEKVRTTLAESRQAAERLLRHGRGALPDAVRVESLKAVLREATALLEANDADGMLRLLEDRKTAERLGAVLIPKTLEVDVYELKSQANDGDFIEDFVDSHVANRSAGKMHSYLEPVADKAYQALGFGGDVLNRIFYPARVDWQHGNFGPAPAEDVPKARAALVKRQLLVAQWEELFHQVDWAVWTATGLSVSESTNTLLAKLNLTYEWWAYHELAVYFYGIYDTKALHGDDVVRARFAGNYPQLRHLVGHSPWVRALLPGR